MLNGLPTEPDENDVIVISEARMSEVNAKNKRKRFETMLKDCRKECLPQANLNVNFTDRRRNCFELCAQSWFKTYNHVSTLVRDSLPQQDIVYAIYHLIDPTDDD
eukprot:TRINITY_DN4235_c0_g1_i1.p1 TRINITY_DN4235_c0_g1~~TRINITY_DN4235_c0_g1_i1.p1  ORF type:complete len:105 (-),score=12.46 TRINITY_DN4235_c0_g1_i1:4-318(-)